MKKVIKTLFSAVLLLSLALAFTGCADDGDEDIGMRVALVAHSPDSILDDGSFNEGAWVGIRRFFDAQGLSHDTNGQFFQPHAADDAVRVDLIEQAIEWGADVLVLPGFQIANALNEAQHLFPDATFIILDASPAEIGNNVIAVHYAEHESGFLAGYAAVREGFTELGFMGGNAIPPVIRFGHGFLLGAEHAANEMGLSPGDITVRFHYLGAFMPSPEVVTTAGAWFVDGTEVIFAAAGGAGGSVMQAAEDQGGLVIGVDVDQSGLSNTVITSAMKALDVSVNDILNEIENGTFVGGREVRFNASMNGVGLPMGTSQFNNFTQAMYNSIFNDIASGAVSVSDALEMDDIRPLLNIVNLIES